MQTYAKNSRSPKNIIVKFTSFLAGLAGGALSVFLINYIGFEILKLIEFNPHSAALLILVLNLL